MTCIVGIAEAGAVWIGGDSAGVDASFSLSIRADEKVFKTGPFVMGFTTSFRMGQLLRYAFTPPTRRVDQGLFAFMVAEFVPAVRACLAAGGWEETDKGRAAGGEFLVGYEGRLFCVHGDYQVAERWAGYFAVGCGAQLALGSLHSTDGHAPPPARIDKALAAAAAFSAGVCSPFRTVMAE